MRTTNEPGRRQNSEVSTPNRPTLARHLLRTHIRSHVDQTRQEYSRTYGRGHRLTPTQARGPTRANIALESKGYSLIRLQDTDGQTIERIILNRSHPHDLQAIIRLSSSSWGNRKPASASPKYRGSTWKAHRELKGMTYSTLFPSARTSSGWDLVCYRNYRGRIFGFPFFGLVRIRVANPHLRPAQFFILIRVTKRIYASHVTPPSPLSLLLIFITL